MEDVEILSIILKDRWSRDGIGHPIYLGNNQVPVDRGVEEIGCREELEECQGGDIIMMRITVARSIPSILWFIGIERRLLITVMACLELIILILSK